MAFNTTIPMSLSYRCYGEEVNTPPPPSSFRGMSSILHLRRSRKWSGLYQPSYHLTIVVSSFRKMCIFIFTCETRKLSDWMDIMIIILGGHNWLPPCVFRHRRVPLTYLIKEPHIL